MTNDEQFRFVWITQAVCANYKVGLKELEQEETRHGCVMYALFQEFGDHMSVYKAMIDDTDEEVRVAAKLLRWSMVNYGLWEGK